MNTNMSLAIYGPIVMQSFREKLVCIYGTRAPRLIVYCLPNNEVISTKLGSHSHSIRILLYCEDYIPTHP